MCSKTNLISILIHFLVTLYKKVDPLFVSVGDYPQYVSADVNRPDCGLRYVPTVYNLTFDKKCFYKKYEDKVFWDISRQIIHQKNKASVSSRIWNGKDADYAEAPWVIHLSLLNSGQKWWRVSYRSCTGILITFEWVLTSAHCDKWDWFEVEVSAGPNAMEGENIILANKGKWFIHPLYTEVPEDVKSVYDIALFKLNQKFNQMTKDKHFLINPICLPKKNQINQNQDNAVFFGYGWVKRKLYISTNPKILQRADIKLNTWDFCRNILGKMFCMNASESDPLSCKGDSGGPLVQYTDKGTRAVLVGVLHGGYYTGDVPNDCKYENPDSGMQWVAVPNYIDWIIETIIDN